ncbi:nitronate monooxygenase [Bradyrhizobium jicamae]|uniref:NAD(P)H-dependent flavin oxidoreductase n=1 Tax=Bradyrhizobium jicamae TaxID=280332 RepID=UPI001BABED56|nr:nitronate monooxygenase family protein [Bradyrhizobium jicamae]MBR0756243.1 nitronate monooxygenase [Bradyrhizobium jicamae]
MPIPSRFANRLTVPVVAAPMFLISGPDLVVGCCQSGVVGTFPALNARTTEGYAGWLDEIGQRLAALPRAAPFGVNLVVHRSNSRLEADLALTIARKVPLVITSLGLNRDLIAAVHDYGGLVFHDVTNLKFAAKAAEAGVDGLIAVTFGAGGHAGMISAFAALQEIRSIFDGVLLLGGSISNGAQIAAARLMGADMAYVGTRFMATQESLAVERLKQMLVESKAADIVYTPAISGIAGNFLRQSIAAAGRDPDNLTPPQQLDFGTTDAKAWKDIWAAGQGVGGIETIPPVQDLCRQLAREYETSLATAGQFSCRQAS